MKRIRPKNTWAYATVAVCFGMVSGIALGDEIETAWGGSEQVAMARLARVMRNPANALAPFESDGCSGGFSMNWRLFIRAMPSLEKQFGDKPPFEDCCIEHDREYWQGSLENGFQARQKADEALRACVLAHGAARQGDYARRFNVPESTVNRVFNLTANLMYISVRIGGWPCTPFGWRWGYGWPLCD